MFSSVLFPLPEGPSRTTNSPGVKVQVDAAEGVHVDLAHVIDLRDPSGGEDGFDRGRGGGHEGLPRGGQRGK